MSRFGNLLNNHPTPAPEPVAEEPVVEVPTAEDDLEEVALEMAKVLESAITIHYHRGGRRIKYD